MKSLENGNTAKIASKLQSASTATPADLMLRRAVALGIASRLARVATRDPWGRRGKNIPAAWPTDAAENLPGIGGGRIALMLGSPMAEPFQGVVIAQHPANNRNMQCQEKREESSENHPCSVNDLHDKAPNESMHEDGGELLPSSCTDSSRDERPSQSQRQPTELRLALGDDRSRSLAFTDEATAQAQCGNDQC